MKKNFKKSSLSPRLLLASLVALCGLSFPRLIAQKQQLLFAGLRSVASQGQFNAVLSDPTGNIYLLLDQKDGVRLLKTDATASLILAQTQLGAQGDIGLAMAFDPTGNIYITGSSTSGTLIATASSAFPSPTGSSTNAFVAKFDSSLNPLFVTFAGSGHIAVSSIAATSTSVFITGSIFSSSLPVTPSAIIQTPASGSSQNGFVEKFNSTGTTLLYATYLSGASGNTAPTAIAVDPTDNAYITGSTAAPGFPTLAAVVPEMIPSAPGSTSGFLTKLTPNGDGLVFSTFIPGSGVSSIAYDATAQNLLLSGSISLGSFPISSAPMPLVPTTYQVLLRIPADGSTVLSSTLIAPGTQSFAIPAPSGAAWITGSLTTPLFPVTPLSTIGNSFAAHVTSQSVVDQTARFGGLPTTNSTYASALVNFTSIASDSTSQPILAGSVTLSASSSLLATETYDLPLFNAPTTALPSILRSATLAPGSCNGSICPGSAAYLAKLNTTVGAPSLALSFDDTPNLTLRNLGSAPASGLQITTTNFNLTTNCLNTFASGGECSIALSGGGPGTITLQANNAATQTITLPTITAPPTPVVFSPKELDFGIQTSTSKPTTRTVTISNLSQLPQTFTSTLNNTSRSLPYTLSEHSSDCPIAGPASTKLLAPGGTCHIALSLAASSATANDGFLQAQWSIGSRSVLLTGYTQAAALSISTPQIDFGTQYPGGLRLPRYLYLSNHSDTPIPHTPVNLVATSPFTIADRCPTTLIPQSVCQLQLDYQSNHPPSFDATTLNLDQGLSVLITGRTLPRPGVNGSAANPNLSVTPTSINFPNAVVVTATSSTTQTVTIGNTGIQPFTLALNLTGDFTDTTNCPSSLPGGSTCTAILTFAPSQPGTRQGLLAITAGNNTTPVFVTLAGTGTPILAVSNGTIDFGNVIVGQPSVQWYKISQPFSSFTATTTSDFTAILVEDIGYGHGQPPSSAFSSYSAGPCTNCWLGIQFKPSAVGLQAATLNLSSSTAGIPSTLTLIGTGLPLTGIILTPVSQDFGSIPISSTSTTTLFTLTNLTSNSAPITLNAPSTTGDFALNTAPTGGAPCTGTLSNTASCFLQIAFTPTTSGLRTGSLALQTSAGTATASLTGYGSPDLGLALNPTSLVFHNVPGPAATQQTITLTNTGTSPLQIDTPTVTISNFQATTTCSTLAPAATCTISVRFTPSTANVADILQIPVTSTIGGSPTLTSYAVPLSGSYTTEDSGLQIIPNESNFGPTSTSTLGLTRQFTINNLTAKSLYLSIALPRQFVLSGPPCAGMAPNASCSFSVTFLPLTNGDITGTLFAQANPTDGSPTLNALGYVEGYGLGANTLAITGNLFPGTLLNFGQVSSGQSASQTLTLTNRGGSTSSPAITIRRITSEWPFLSTSTCGQTLALNQSCTVTVTYTPLNQAASGTASPQANTDAGTLIIESDALTSPDIIDLAGSAAPILIASPSNTAPIISFTASQSSLTFATTLVGNVSATQTVTLANTGTTALHISNLQNTSDFTSSSACNTILPAASCNIIIAFTPKSSGTRISALEISSDASTSLDFISLIGAANPSFLALAPAALDFGTVLVGHTALLPFQVTNTGTTPVTFNAITATGDYSATGTCLSAPLPATSSCTVQIAFTPTLSGTRSGTLSLASSTSALPLTAGLTGIGAQSHLLITPSSLNFGSITVGASANLSLTLTNTGNAPVVGIGIGLPPATGDFAITTPCAVVTLAPGTSCSVGITFTPTATGALSNFLTITSSASTSPDIVPLTGAGLPNGNFSLTVNGAPTSTVTVLSGHPATYTLTLTPQNNFAGTVVLNCSPITPAPFASCSLLPSSITLAGASQNALATINTITSTTLGAQQDTGAGRLSRSLLCLLTPTLFFFWRGRTRLSSRPWSYNNHRPATFWTITFATAALATLLTATGCGSGGDPSLRYAPPGTYQYQVTANSTSGVQITQSVILNLTITSR